MDCGRCKHCEIIEGGKHKLNDGTLITSKVNILKCKLDEVKSITIADGEAVCSDFEEIDNKK